MKSLACITFFVALTFVDWSMAGEAPWMGVNMEGCQDWQPNRMFADAMKTSRGWGSAATPWDLAAPIDSDGWPTADAGVVVMTLAQYHDIGGIYKLSFTGQANVAGVACLAAIQNKLYDSVSNTTTCDVVVDPTNVQLMLSFTGTNGGVSNVKLMRPGYTNETFTTSFLNLIQPFSCLRFVWYSQVINSPVVNWSDRTLPTNATQNRRVAGGLQQTPIFYGACWEYAIQLANQTGKDMWVNIPDQATDDYVTQFATLLKNNVNPGIHIYVEWSNEVWNGGYAETGRNYNAAQAEVATGTSPLNYDGQTNPGYLAWRRVGKRTKEVSDLFRAVFGDAAMMTQVRPVLCMQNGQTMTIRQPLELIDNVYGAPSHYLYAIACAPYWGIPTAWDSRTDLSVDDIISALPANLASTMNAATDWTVWAHWYNVKFMTYEGGPSLTGANSLNAKIAASHDPRIQAIVASFVDQFNQIGGDFLNYYTSVAYDSQYGTFGLTDQDTNLNTPKYQAIIQELAMPRAAATAGIAVPATIGAGSFNLQSGYNAPGSASMQLTAGAWYNYLIRVPAPGNYTLTARVSSTAGGQMQASLNDSPVTTWTVPNTGSNQTFVPLTQVNLPLAAGLNVIRMSGQNGTFYLQSVTIGAVPSIVSDRALLTVNEGASASFNLSLSAQPSSNVVVNVSRFSGNVNIGVSGGASLTFTPSNWNVAQPVTLSAANGNYNPNASATLRCAANGYPSLDVTAAEQYSVATIPALATISVSPPSATIALSGSQTFTALGVDQYGNAITPQPTFHWAVNGGGSIDSTGLFTVATAGGPFTVTAASGNFNGTAQVTVIPSPIVPLPITFLSAPTAAPNPAEVNQPVQFSAVATAAGAVAYAWDFGDGLKDSSGASAQHTYASAGSFTVTVVVSDALGQRNSANVVVVVNPQPLQFGKVKMQGKVNFIHQSKDACSINATLPGLPAPLTLAGATVILEISGVRKEFVLDGTGFGANADGVLILSLKKNLLSVRLANGSWAEAWSGLGIDPHTTVKNSTLQFDIRLSVETTVFTGKATVKYASRAGKSGSFKSAQR